MESIGKFLQEYATKEVFTVVAAFATAWVGWKAATKTVGMMKGFAAKASFAGLTSAILLLAGFGGLGMGIGELASRTGEEEQPKPTETQLTNEQLVTLATSDTEEIEEILKYATTRDTAARDAIKTTLTNEQLVKLATSENLEEILKYATTRDKAAQDKAAREAVAELLQVQLKTSKDVMLTAKQKPYEELPFEVKEQEVAIKNDESIMTTPMAWMTIGLGLASLIGSFGVFTTRKV